MGLAGPLVTPEPLGEDGRELAGPQHPPPGSPVLPEAPLRSGKPGSSAPTWAIRGVPGAQGPG